MAGATTYDERTLRRRAISAISEDEEGSVQALLGLLSREPVTIPVAETFDARSARSRLAVLALSLLRPRHLQTGLPIDVVELIESEGASAFRPIVAPEKGDSGLSRGPANRMLHPGTGPTRGLVLARFDGDRASILESHAIPPLAADAPKEGKRDEFLRIRLETLTKALNEFAARFTGWERGDRDRPSMEYLLRMGASP
ncbi:MAG: hypothetical protein ACRD3V_18840, partial [Vicinamibacteria bacterium]